MTEKIVSSLEEALDLCEELRSNGFADYFRGQSRDWPEITPGLFRPLAKKREQVEDELSAFISWSKNVPQMAVYHDSDDAITAIAQHYGMPTRFLDITTSVEIASIFSKISEPSDDDMAVIYCFAEGDLQAISGCRVLQIDVANLWRLEAQCGAFLEYKTAEASAAVRACAHTIKFPAVALSQAEITRIYPERKSALEIVLDQWFYRDQVQEFTASFSNGGSIVATARRHTYPGAFVLRGESDFSPEWVGNDPSWIFPRTEQVTVSGAARQLKLTASWQGDPEKLYRETLLFLGENLPGITGSELTVDFFINSESTEHSKAVSSIINRCVDGLRIWPFRRSDVVLSLARTITLLFSRAHDYDPTTWYRNVLGETLLIDTAPIGGHISTGEVSKSDFLSCLNDLQKLPLTKFFSTMALSDPLQFMNYVVDPWTLLDFEGWSSLYATQFIPSVIDEIWMQDLANYDGGLESLWTVSFNPALLAYVTTSQYRFWSPLAYDKNVENHIYIFPDMDVHDMVEAIVACYPRIVEEDLPFKVLFHGYSRDDRPIWKIPEVVQKAKSLIEIGGLSPLDVLGGFGHQMGKGDPPKFGEPEGLGAFEIWLIANEKLEWLQGRHLSESRQLFEALIAELPNQNAIFEKLSQETMSRYAELY